MGVFARPTTHAGALEYCASKQARTCAGSRHKDGCCQQRQRPRQPWRHACHGASLRPAYMIHVHKHSQVGLLAVAKQRRWQLPAAHGFSVNAQLPAPSGASAVPTHTFCRAELSILDAGNAAPHPIWQQRSTPYIAACPPPLCAQGHNSSATQAPACCQAMGPPSSGPSAIFSRPAAVEVCQASQESSRCGTCANSAQFAGSAILTEAARAGGSLHIHAINRMERATCGFTNATGCACPVLARGPLVGSARGANLEIEGQDQMHWIVKPYNLVIITCQRSRHW